MFVTAFVVACGGPLDDGAELASTSSPLCTGATLTATQTGSVVALAASASCAAAPEYLFFVREPGAVAYAPLGEYGSSATLQWDATGRAAGLYSFRVDVRESGSSAPLETSATTARLVGSVCSTAALSITGATATTLTLTGSATCTAGVTPEYRFLVRAPGAAFAEARPYGTAATFTWDTAGLPGGRYDVQVQVRAVGNASAYEATAAMSRTVGAACTSATLSATPRPDGIVDLSASAVCSAGATPEYRFLFRGPGGAGLTEIRPYGTTATHAWDTAGLPAGKYELVAYTRAAGNASSYEATGTGGALVGAVCTSAALSATRDAASGRLDLAATAVCAAGATPEYRFMVRPPGGAPAELRAYSTAATFSMATAGIAPGRYEFSVYVRASGNASAYEAFEAATLEVGNVCTAAALTVKPGTGALTLAATATCEGGAVPEYRFLVRPPGATAYSQLRAYGRDPQLVVSTSGARPGAYGFAVYVRAAGNLSQYETAAAASYTLE